MARWTDEQLDDLRRRGDPLADDFLARLDDLSGPDEAAHATVARLAASGGLVAPDPVVRALVDAWTADTSMLPAWADADRMRRGHAVFAEHGLLIGLCLYCASLPEAYASAKGAKALWLTGSLVTETDRRVNETAQFLLDTLEPGGVDSDGGRAAIRRVRLMHAAVRRFILHDPRIARVDDDAATGSCWSSTWGTPLNQEELLGTLLTFTLVVFDALGRLGVTLSADETDAYLHLWCVIGWMLGIAPEVLPFDVAAARELEPIIRRRLQGAGPEGRGLEAALLTSTSARLPRPLQGVPRWLTCRCSSPEALAVLGIGPPVAHAAGLGRLTALEAQSVVVRRLAEWTSTGLLFGLVRAGRGSRPPFEIPAALGEAWGVDSRSPFRMFSTFGAVRTFADAAAARRRRRATR